MSTAGSQSISESAISQVPCLELCDTAPKKRAPNKPILPLTEKQIAKFWSHVEIGAADECWLWTGGTASAGGKYSPGVFYGVWRHGYKVHRVAYAITYGEISPGMTIDHVWARGCRSTLCVNPAHLEEISQTEQVKRRRRHGPKPGAVYKTKPGPKPPRQPTTGLQPGWPPEAA